MPTTKTPTLRNRNAEYWEERFRLLEEAKQKPIDDFVDNMVLQYGRAIKNIEGKLNAFYRLFADEEKISVAEAKRLLLDTQLKTFRMDVEEYIKLGQANAEHFDKTVAKELERASVKYRVTRLEALNLQIKAEVANLEANVSAGTYEALAKVYREQYARTAFEVFKGAGVMMTDFAIPDWDAIDSVLRKPWRADGLSFAQRSGGYSKQLMADLETEMAALMISGEGYEEAAQRFRGKIGSTPREGALYRARRTIYTEAAFFQCEAQRQCYVDLGVERYRFRSELNTRVCDRCGKIDNQVFELKDRVIGANYPPMHPFCRCIAVPCVDNSNVPGYVKGTRSGRNLKGKSVLFPEDMTYKEWYKRIGAELEDRQRGRKSNRRSQ